MNEAETRAELIDPKLKSCGWGVVEGSKVLREYSITAGKIQTGGGRGKREIADLEELKKSVLQKAFSGQLSESGLAGLKDKQDLSNVKKSGKSLNQLNPDSDNFKDKQDLKKVSV